MLFQTRYLKLTYALFVFVFLAHLEVRSETVLIEKCNYCNSNDKSCHGGLESLLSSLEFDGVNKCITNGRLSSAEVYYSFSEMNDYCFFQVSLFDFSFAKNLRARTRGSWAGALRLDKGKECTEAIRVNFSKEVFHNSYILLPRNMPNSMVLDLMQLIRGPKKLPSTLGASMFNSDFKSFIAARKVGSIASINMLDEIYRVVYSKGSMIWLLTFIWSEDTGEWLLSGVTKK